ncbi:MAG: ATP-binding cassette domain-containing protein [Bacilli bacterium]|nr:ATP-binding cassette domain-containing protein [Bacilli bacterium]
MKALKEECPKKERLNHVIAVLGVNQFTAKAVMRLHLTDEAAVEAAKAEIEGKIEARRSAIEQKGFGLDDNYALLKNGEPILVKAGFRRYEIDEKVRQASAILGLDEYLERRPKALSGGQRQRVALGRAIVRQPKVFLMDEPLSNLDAKLRVQTRSEITKIHRQVGATTIYVTHDQTEAMTMADRIVVMKDGRVQQIGTPKEVYQSPANIFVGGFIGTPPMNFLKGKILQGNFVVEGEEKPTYSLNDAQRKMLESYEGKDIILGIRPEACFIDPKGFVVKTDVVELLGSELIVYAVYGGQKLVFKVSAKLDISNNQEVSLSFDPDVVHFFDPETTERIHD